jgi:hypothetical protein
MGVNHGRIYCVLLQEDALQSCGAMYGSLPFSVTVPNCERNASKSPIIPFFLSIIIQNNEFEDLIICNITLIFKQIIQSQKEGSWQSTKR